MVEELLAARGIIVSHETVRAAKREIMPGIEHRQHKDSTTEQRIRTSPHADESGK